MYAGLSPYNYCANNPVNVIDPDGGRMEASYYDALQANLDYWYGYNKAQNERLSRQEEQAFWGQVHEENAANKVESAGGNDNSSAPDDGKKTPNSDKNGTKGPGWDPTKSPGVGFKWEGNGTPESGEGAWVRRDPNGEPVETWHPDLNHGDPGPHWDHWEGNRNSKGKKEYTKVHPDGHIVGYKSNRINSISPQSTYVPMSFNSGGYNSHMWRESAKAAAQAALTIIILGGITVLCFP